MNLFYFLSMLPILFIYPVNSDQYVGIYDARIETDASEGKLVINNVFENNSRQTVNFSYKFKCKRTGLSGASGSSQAGTFKAAPGEIISLSSTVLSYTEDDSYTLSLQVFNKAGVVASDTYTSDSE